MHEAVLILLFAVNLTAFLLYGIDKKKAVQGNWRISESVLILAAVLGGGIGAYIGMRFFHHKTRKLVFAVGVPLIILAEYGAYAVSCLHS